MGHSSFAPTSHLPVASIRPPPLRNDAAYNRAARGARGGPPAAPQPGVRGPPGRELAPDAAGGPTLRARGATDSAGGRGQLQSNRSDGGGRGAGTSVGSPRWVRIFRMTTGSSMVATTRMRPPQRGQANTSTAKVWRNTSGHDQARRAGDGGSSTAREGTCAGPGAGLDDASALGGPSFLTTGSRCDAPLASRPPADHGALGGTGGAAVPHRTAASGPTGSSVSRP